MKVSFPDNAGTTGRHLILECHGCDPNILDNQAEIEKAIIAAVQSIGMTVTECLLHPFSPQGVTGAFLLDTGRLTLHTWPEHSYAAIDLYTSSERDFGRTSEALARILNTQNQVTVTIERGLSGPQLVRVMDHIPVESVTFDFRQPQLPEGFAVGKSPGRGVGLFATRPFEAGEVLYRASGVLVNWMAECIMETDLGTRIHSADDLGYELIPAFIETWSRALRRVIAEYYELVNDTPEDLLYALTDETEYGILITGVNGLQNHSDTPNTRLGFTTAHIDFDAEGRPHWLLPVHALCPIRAGDELFSDYRHALPDFVPDKDWLP